MSPDTAKWLLPAEAWRAGYLPPIDFQMHTTWTDGRSTAADMIEAARARKLKAIAITEHFNEQSTWYPDFVAQMKELRQHERDLEVYFGVEAAARDYRGGLKAEPGPADAELVLGVVHSYPKEEGGFWSFANVTPAQGLDMEIRALIGLTNNERVDVIGHPGGTTYRKFGAFPVERLEPVFRAAKERGKAIELNTKYMWDLPGYLHLLWRINPVVSFGSDAHSANDVGVNYTGLVDRWGELTQASELPGICAG